MFKIESKSAESVSHKSTLGAEDRLDRWGALLGIMCAVHCALTPFSVLLMPIFGLGVMWTSKGEIALLILALLFTVPSLKSAKARRKGKRIIAFFILSWSLLVAATLLKHAEHSVSMSEKHLSETAVHHDDESALVHHHEPLSITLAVLGGLGLATAHLFHLRERRKAHKSCCSS